MQVKRKAYMVVLTTLIFLVVFALNLNAELKTGCPIEIIIEEEKPEGEISKKYVKDAMIKFFCDGAVAKEVKSFYYNYTLDPDCGKYELEVSHEDFITIKKTINCNDSKLTIKMKKKDKE